MPKQAGIFPIEGTMGNVTFYKSEEGYLIREKGGVSKERIATDPKFARTRENNSQFGLNAKAGKLVRDAIAALLKKAKDKRVTSRLTKVMSEVAKYDRVSIRGQKKIAIALENEAACNILKGFNFNNQAIMETILTAPCSLTPESGIVEILDFIPEEQINAPAGATHVGFKSAFTALNFAKGQTQTAYSDQIILPLNLTLVSVVLNPNTIPQAGASAKLMISILVEFYQELDGVKYPLLNGAYNALSILDIE